LFCVFERNPKDRLELNATEADLGIRLRNLRPIGAQVTSLLISSLCDLALNAKNATVAQRLI
jgi:hypothetical protein